MKVSMATRCPKCAEAFIYKMPLSFNPIKNLDRYNRLKGIHEFHIEYCDRMKSHEALMTEIQSLLDEILVACGKGQK